MLINKSALIVANVIIIIGEQCKESNKKSVIAYFLAFVCSTND